MSTKKRRPAARKTTRARPSNVEPAPRVDPLSKVDPQDALNLCALLKVAIESPGLNMQGKQGAMHYVGRLSVAAAKAQESEPANG